jgi:hypothetical protein
MKSGDASAEAPAARLHARQICFFFFPVGFFLQTWHIPGKAWPTLRADECMRELASCGDVFLPLANSADSWHGRQQPTKKSSLLPRITVIA